MKELEAQPILTAQAQLGEGAIWDHQRNLLHWVDIDGFQIHTFDPKTKVDKSIDLPNYVGAVVKRDEKNGGGFVASLPHKFVHVDESGNVNVLAEIAEERRQPNNRMNDGKCDPAGRFWCGSMAFDFKIGAGNLWMMDERLQVHKKLSDVAISNGIVWSSDSRTMYYIDTGMNRIYAFDFVIETGEISNRRTVAINMWGGYFDGMTIDKDDMLYVAIWNGSAIYKIDPNKAARVATINVPNAKNITSCAFGGDDLQDLYITSASVDTDRKRFPNAGDLFHIKLTDTQGVPSTPFAG